MTSALPTTNSSPPSPVSLKQRISSFTLWRKKPKSFSGRHQNAYHDYVSSLVCAGWENLGELDTYLDQTPPTQAGLIVSVLDITQNFATKRWPDLTSEHDVARFLKQEKKGDSPVRFIIVEYKEMLSSGAIEALGAALKLDPRFFNWCTKSKGHVFTPSQSHRAPYVSLGFGILDASTPRVTDAERFKVMVYIQPDGEGIGWTGMYLHHLAMATF